MKVFRHHLYEYKKGLRALVLHTTSAEHEAEISAKLDKDGIAHIIHHLGKGSMNVFFGKNECISVLEVIGVGKLSELSDEEDFMLGIMLGYDRLQQCERYLKRSSSRTSVEDLVG